MSLGRLGRGELLAVIGGILLALGLFLPGTRRTPTTATRNIDGVRGSVSGWNALPVLRWLLLAAAVAPMILAWVIARDHQLSWPRGEMTAVVGDDRARAGALRRRDRPPRRPAGEISLKYGWFLALLGCLLTVARRRRCAPPAPNDLASPLESYDARADIPPDRNLALELVRVTEAAALAAARLVGMGDKEAADQAAVDGMHAVLHTIHMDGDRGHRRGREGRGADARQRRGGRRRHAAARGHRRRPARGHAARRPGPAERAGGDRALRARDDVRPRPGLLHGEDGRRASRSPTCSTSTGRSARPSSWSPSAAASRCAT